MSNVRFIGCLHFRHPKIAKLRGFKDVYEHDEYLIKTWNKTVHKNDSVYILGDITMENSRYYPMLNLLKGRKKVILGNHDLAKDVSELLKFVETVSGCEKYKGYILSHIPIHPTEIKYWRGNIHAHIHENTLREVEIDLNVEGNKTISSPTLYKYYNVDAYKIRFTPKTLVELEEEKIF